MEENITIVSPETETICCDGGQDGLGHPAVYYSFDNQYKVVCGYCGKIYVKEKE
ncbi:zinc-finger domain-containing protein [Pelagibacteraceae bacterium]|nr:zinc-finger domain-containing protein [Pelagibacteraceae bacterium]